MTDPFVASAARPPGQVARPFTEAGDCAEAIPRRLAAGRRAVAANANAAAVEHLRSGLALLQQQPAGASRDAQELALLLPLGQALLALRGYGSTEAAEVFDRAFLLSQRPGIGEQRFEALWGLWMVSSSREDASFAESAQLSRKLLALADAAGDPAWRTRAYSASANIALWRGDFELACQYAEASVATVPGREPLPALDGHDPRVASHAYRSWARWCQGLDTAALEASRQGIALARALDHSESLCFALFFATWLQGHLGDLPAAWRCLDESQPLADRYGMAIWQANNALMRGWLLALSGRADGLDHIDAGIERIREAMPGVIGVFLHLQAEALALVGQTQAMLKVVDVALRTAERQDAHFLTPDLYRLKGQGLLRLQRRGAAMKAFEAALRVAEARGARGLAARVLMQFPVQTGGRRRGGVASPTRATQAQDQAE